MFCEFSGQCGLSGGTNILTRLPHVASLVVLTAKNFFRVSYRTGGQLQSHCFQASDTFNKQQWINCIRQAKEAAALTGEQLPVTGPCLQMGLGGQIGPVLSPCCHLRQGCERVVWGETDSGQCLEAEASLGGVRDIGPGEELLADGGMSLGTDTETRRCEEVTPVAGSETGDGALDNVVGVWEMGGGEGDTRAEAADDVSASLGLEEEEREEMEKEQSGAVEEEAVSMDTGQATSSQREEDTHRC